MIDAVDLLVLVDAELYDVDVRKICFLLDEGVEVSH